MKYTILCTGVCATVERSTPDSYVTVSTAVEAVRHGSALLYRRWDGVWVLVKEDCLGPNNKLHQTA